MRIVGHRGAAAMEPENTLRSFAKALELGAEAVEFDVHLTLDGRLAVIHDETVDRTTNGVGRVADLTLDDIQRLRVAGTERVPSLDEVIEWAAGRTFLHVEIKAPAALRPAVDLLVAKGLVGRCRISSFWHRAVQEVKTVVKEMETGVLYAASPVKCIQLAIDAGADALHPSFHYVTGDLLREARERGLKVAAWTVDEASEIARLAKMGVDEIITNRPDVARSVLKFLAEAKDAPPRAKTEEERQMDARRAEIQALMKTPPGCPEGPRQQGQKPGW